MTLKVGSSSVLSPAAEHPLQGIDSPSPSPLKPLHTGSTSALYSPPVPVSVSIVIYFVLLLFLND